MNKEKKYYRHLKHGFIIEVTEEVEVLFDENWIRVDGLPVVSLIGKIVAINDKSIEEVGYFSNGWVKELFEECSKYHIEIDSENEMWIATDLSRPDIENYYGGYLELGDEKSYRVEFEWDCDLPNDYEEIETEILKHI